MKRRNFLSIAAALAAIPAIPALAMPKHMMYVVTYSVHDQAVLVYHLPGDQECLQVSDAPILTLPDKTAAEYKLPLKLLTNCSRRHDSRPYKPGQLHPNAGCILVNECPSTRRYVDFLKEFSR